VRATVFIALAVLGTGCRGPAVRVPEAQYAVPAPAAGEDPLRALNRKVFDKVNRQRRLHGLRELAWDEAVAGQARLQSSRMMDRGFFSHSDPLFGGLGVRLNAAGVSWNRCGENIFREKGMEDPPDEAVEGWMKSPSHRESILDPLYTQSGVGIAISPDTEYFITQIFIRPNK
jgi:uncharacterized protein YkwD